jgi:hypothetical protein
MGAQPERKALLREMVKAMRQMWVSGDWPLALGLGISCMNAESRFLPGEDAAYVKAETDRWIQEAAAPRLSPPLPPRFDGAPGRSEIETPQGAHFAARPPGILGFLCKSAIGGDPVQARRLLAGRPTCCNKKRKQWRPYVT